VRNRPLRWALAAALVLAGCGAEPERPADPPTVASDSVTAEPEPPANPFAETARRALRIELDLDDYLRVEGTWAADDAASTFTAHFAGDTLRFIEERMSTGEVGARTTVYYFEEGALFYAVEDAVRTRIAPGTSGADSLQTRVAFDSEGRVRAAQQVISGAAGPAPEAEVERLREHAATLRARAHALRSSAEPAV
jgi:hypothetical protein